MAPLKVFRELQGVGMVRDDGGRGGIGFGLLFVGFVGLAVFGGEVAIV